MKRVRLVIVLAVSLALISLLFAPALVQADGPVGEIVMWAGSSGDVPDGWLLTNGDAISRTLYADLFDVIGTTYGVGDGSTTFNLPNFDGRVPVGAYEHICGGCTWTYNIGDTGGEEFHTLTVGEIPAHQHGLPYSINGFLPGGDWTFPPAYSPPNSGTIFGATNFTGGGGAHNNMPPYLAIYFIIRAQPPDEVTPTPTPTGTITPTPTATPDPNVIQPYVYTHTLQSGHQLTVPVRASFGQLLIATVSLGLIAVVVVDFTHRLVYRR